jgi:hypothetical protein
MPRMKHDVHIEKLATLSPAHTISTRSSDPAQRDADPETRTSLRQNAIATVWRLGEDQEPACRDL